MLLKKAVAALLGLLPRRTETTTRLTTDRKPLEDRIEELRSRGVPIEEDAVQELDPDIFTVVLKTPHEDLAEALAWAAEHLGDGIEFQRFGDSRFGNDDFGFRALANGKICVQLGRGRDSGFKEALHEYFLYNQQHPPTRDSIEHKRDRASAPERSTVSAPRRGRFASRPRRRRGRSGRSEARTARGGPRVGAQSEPKPRRHGEDSPIRDRGAAAAGPRSIRGLRGRRGDARDARGPRYGSRPRLE